MSEFNLHKQASVFDSEPASATVRVLIENCYEDRHTSTCEVVVRAPKHDEDLEEWFEEVVFQHTGDGHGAGNDLGLYHLATIIGPAGRLVGSQSEWNG